MSNLLRSVLSVFTGKIVTLVLGLVFTPILVRLISQEEYGIYATLLAGFSVLALFSQVGLFDATRKSVAEASENNQTQSDIVSTAMLLSLAYACLALIIIGSLLLFDLVPERYALYLSILLIGLLFKNVYSVIRGAFHGKQKEHVSEILKVIKKGTYVFLAIAILLLGGNLAGVFVMYTVSFIIVVIVGIYLLAIEFRLTFPLNMISYARNLFRYGGTQMVGGISAALMYQTDVLLVEFFRSSTETAIYRAALLPAEYLWFIPSVIQVVFLQHAAKLWSENNIEEINNQLSVGIKYATLSLSLFGIGLLPLAGPFMEVYFGSQYREGLLILQILIGGTFLFGLSRVIIPVFQATGWIKYTEIMTFIVMLLNVGLNLILIPQYGMLGAAIGTSVSYAMMIVGALIIWDFSVFPYPHRKTMLKLVFPQILFASLYIPIVLTIDLSDLLSLLIFPPIGLVIFVSSNILFGNISISNIYIPLQLSN